MNRFFDGRGHLDLQGLARNLGRLPVRLEERHTIWTLSQVTHKPNLLIARQVAFYVIKAEVDELLTADHGVVPINLNPPCLMGAARSGLRNNTCHSSSGKDNLPNSPIANVVSSFADPSRSSCHTSSDVSVSRCGRSLESPARQSQGVIPATSAPPQRPATSTEHQRRFLSLLEKPARSRKSDCGDHEEPAPQDAAIAPHLPAWHHHAWERPPDVGIAPPSPRPALPIAATQRLFVSDGAIVPEVRIQIGAGPLAGTEVRLTKVGAAVEVQVAAAGSMSDRLAVERAIGAVRDRLRRRDADRATRQRLRPPLPDDAAGTRDGHAPWSPSS